MAKLFAPDSLGKPNQGLHRHVAGIAVFDVVATIGVGYAISRTMRWNFALTTAGVFAVGQLAHWYYCVPTMMTRELGLLSPSCEK